MSIYSIEFNDSELRVAKGRELVARSPGYAVVRARKIDVGSEAAARAHLHPRETFNQFWRELSQSPVANGGEPRRSHADLAYLHLQHLRELAGRPDSALFAVPGSFSKEQLGLLLGIAAACHIKPLGLVDTAVAAAAGTLASGDYTHIDLHQHDAVLTRLAITEQVTRRGIEVVSGAGLNRLHAGFATVIVKAFLAQARFDPLRHADTEQLLHNQLPGWLKLLAREPELQLQLNFRGTRFEARVTREQLVASALPQLHELSARVVAGDRFALADRCASVPGCERVFAAGIPLPLDAVSHGCVLNAGLFGSGLPAGLTTQLPATQEPLGAVSQAPARRSADAARATHILVQHRAYRLTRVPLFLAPGGRVEREAAADAVCRVVANDDGPRLAVLNGAQVLLNGNAAAGMAALNPGDRITFSGAGGNFVSITVMDTDGT